MSAERPDVVVAGAGLAGLSCAVALGDHGLRVHVVEADARVGGRAQSHRDPVTGDVVDIGPHVVMTEYANFLALLERLGTYDRICWPPNPFMTVIHEGRAYEIHNHHALPPPFGMMPSMLRAPLTFPELVSNTRAALEAMRASDDELLALDAIPGSEHLAARGVAPRHVDWFWRSLAIWILNVPLERCSTTALLRLFRQLVGSRGLAMGIPNEGLAETYAGAAVAAIAARGGTVSLGSRIVALGRTDAGFRIGLADGAALVAPVLVSALPPAALAALVPAEWIAREPALAELGRFRPSAYVSSYLWFDRKLGERRYWAHAWSPTQLHYDFYDLSRIRAGWGERPSIIACNLIDAQRAEALDDRAILEAAIADIAEAAPGARAARVTHASVHRIPMAVPYPEPGTERARPAQQTAIPGFALAGDWTRTLLPCSMESAVRSGFLAAEAVLAARGVEARIARPPPQPRGLVALLHRRDRPQRRL